MTPSLSKTVGSSTIAANGTTSYTIVIGNAGPNVMTTASVVDTLPAGVTTSAAGIVATPAGGASVPTAFTIAGTSVSGSVTIPVNGTVTVVIQVTATVAGN